MYLGHATVEDFRGVTRGLAPWGLTVRVARDLGKEGFEIEIGMWMWIPYRPWPRVGVAGVFPCWEYRCSRSRESWLAFLQAREYCKRRTFKGRGEERSTDLI